MPDVERSTEGCARVMGGRLNVNIAERRLFENPAVSGAIQRHSSGEAKFLDACLAMNVVQHCEVTILERGLGRGREIGMTLADFIARIACGAESRCKFRRVDGPHTGLAAIPCHLDAAVV